MSNDLFDSAYVPDWALQLHSLSDMALTEPWSFPTAQHEKLRKENVILEKYIFSVFRHLVIHAQSVPPEESSQYMLVRNGYACFSTGLLTKRYKPIYCFMERNDFGHNHYWKFRGFFDDTSPQLRKVEELPKKPFFYLQNDQWGYSPNLPIRVNIDHILDDAANVERIPEYIRGFPNLYMLLQTGVEMARRTAEFIPSIVVPQLYQGRIQFLLPICLTDPHKTDMAMTISPMEGYYIG